MTSAGTPPEAGADTAGHEMSAETEQRVTTAFHEAGHALIGCLYGRPPISVDIVPDEEGNVGHTHFPDDGRAYRRWFDRSPEKRRYIETRVLTALGGTLATNIRRPNRPEDIGDRKDADHARQLIAESASWEADHVAYLSRLSATATRVLKNNWPAVERVAAALLQRDGLQGEEVEAMVSDRSGSGSTEA